MNFNFLFGVNEMNRQHTIASFTKSDTDFRMKSEKFGGDIMHDLDDEEAGMTRRGATSSSIAPEHAEAEMVAMRIEKYTNRTLTSWEDIASSNFSFTTFFSVFTFEENDYL